MEKGLLSIIIVNYNSSHQILELFQSLKQSTFQKYEIIIVDNASPDDDLKSFARKAVKGFKLVKSFKNLGFAAGNNLGMRYARGEYILLLNPDVVLEEDSLGTLVNTLKERPEVAVVSPKICYYEQPDCIQYAGCGKMHPIFLQALPQGKHCLDQGQFDTPQYTAYAHGAAMLFRRSILEEVGEMEESYFLYYEELDWCHRVLKAGHKVYYQPKVKVLHKESTSTGKNSPLKTYYLNRNRLLFARLHFRWYQQILAFLYIFFISFPKQIWQRRNEFKAMKAYLNAIYWHFTNWNLNTK